jgi:hypothetical protein
MSEIFKDMNKMIDNLVDITEVYNANKELSEEVKAEFTADELELYNQNK